MTPSILESAMELEAASENLEAASQNFLRAMNRFQEALAGVSAAVVIEQAKESD